MGLTEAEAAERHPGAKVAHLDLEHVDRAIAAGAEDGFVKLIAAPRPMVGHLGGGRLVGATVVAPTGGELIHDAALAMQIFMIFPVAPPRLMPTGFVDTVTELSNSYRVLQPPSLVNKFAAVPSLHVGWNLLVGILIFRTSRSGAAQLFAMARHSWRPLWSSRRTTTSSTRSPDRSWH